MLPDYYTYPLMFHLPQMRYAWQLQPEQQSVSQFKDRPPIDFLGQGMPDCIIAFGPVVENVVRGFRPPPGIVYDLTTLDVFWKDEYRPELMLRTFDLIPA